MRNALRYMCFAVVISILCIVTPGQDAKPDLTAKYAEEGQTALAEGRNSAAEVAFEKLRDLDPTIAEVRANLGAVYFQERKYDRAIPELRQAIRLKPSLSKAATLLAISLSEVGSYREAIPGLEKAFARETDGQVKRMCGLQLLRAYSGLQQDEKAVRTALELNRLFDQDPEVLYHTGRIYGNFAYLTMKKLGAIAPDSVWRNEAAGEAYQSQGAYQPAINAYESVLKADPNMPGIHFRLGRVYQERYRTTHAEEDMQAALRQYSLELQVAPRNASAAYEIAEIYRTQGNLSSAETYFRMALEYYPDFQEAQVGLGAILDLMDKGSEALLHLEKGVKLNPSDEIAWYRLSQVQRKLGNTQESQRALGEFKRLHQSSQGPPTQELFSPTEVSKQEIEPTSEP